MKVLHWLNTFSPDTGGIQSLCAELLPALSERGHEIVMLTAHTAPSLPDRSSDGPIEIRRVDSLRPLLDRDPGRILRARIEIARIVEEIAPDIVHLHPCGPDMAYYTEVNRRRPRLTVATLHNNYSRVGVEFSPASLFARAFAMTSRVATVSHDSRRWLLSVRPELAGTTCTIHNGLPVSDAPVVPLPWSPPTLMYVGRVEAQKRLDVLLRAFAQLVETHPNVRLRIVGAGTESGSVAQLARSLGVEHRVELLGRVELDEVPRLLDEATVAVLSSDFEGLPMALLEAARQGRPTVATAVGGVPELVLDGHTGLLVDRDSPQAFARAVATLLDDRPLAERLGRAARARFTAEFSLDACADAYDRLYHEVAEAHPRVPAEAMAGMG